MSVLVAPAPPAEHADHERELVLRLLAAASFLIFFQSYLVAPLIPSLSREFHASPQLIGLLVPAYLLPYGFSTLIYGPLADRLGRRGVLLALLAVFALTTAGCGLAKSAMQLLIWRAAAGVATGGIIPIGLALLADLFPYAQRGRPLGWVFGAIAGGVAFGSTLGAVLNPLIGWRMTFVALGVAAVAVFAITCRHQGLLNTRTSPPRPHVSSWFHGYRLLLANPRGGRAYAYITLNGIFHAGIFAWLGVYFHRRFGLGDIGVGLALLGYGVPGMLLGPAIGRAADRIGRRTIMPIGLAIAALAAGTLALRLPLLSAAAVVAVLSLGFDMTHPLLAGIVTSLDPARRGQAMGLNAFVLFTGFGLGSLIFQGALDAGGFAIALGAFAAVQLVLALLAVPLFSAEGSHHA